MDCRRILVLPRVYLIGLTICNASAVSTDVDDDDDERVLLLLLQPIKCFGREERERKKRLK